MRALLSTVTGGPQTLRIVEVAEPEPSAGQVRIAVRACAVNYLDLLLIHDKYQLKPTRPFSPGSEVAGVIDTIGADVRDFSAGDLIVAITGLGGMAEKVVADAARCFKIPSSMSSEVAAGFLTAYTTSYHALKHRAALEPGEKLLVLGAAGGVGLAAVELGKTMGARVIAAVSSAAKGQIAAQHGADEIIVYPAKIADSRQLERFFKQACKPDGADVIFDAVGGGYTVPALRSIAWSGRFLVVGFPAGIASVPLNLALLKGCAVVGVYFGAYARRAPESFRKCVAELLDLYSQRRLHPLVSKVFSLERAADALVSMADRTAVGKLIVSLPH